MELFKETHLQKLELLSNATTIDSALQFIRNKQAQQKKESRWDSIKDDEQITATTTTATGKQTIF